MSDAALIAPVDTSQVSLQRPLPNGAKAMLAQARQDKSADGLKQVSEDFEAFYASQIFEQMFAGLEPDEETGGGDGEKMFRSLLIQEYGKAAAKQHTLGIADVVQRQLLQLQEVK
jgi:flagellar protein FlgJ